MQRCSGSNSPRALIYREATYFEHVGSRRMRLSADQLQKMTDSLRPPLFMRLVLEITRKSRLLTSFEEFGISSRISRSNSTKIISVHDPSEPNKHSLDGMFWGVKNLAFSIHCSVCKLRSANLSVVVDPLQDEPDTKSDSITLTCAVLGRAGVTTFSDLLVTDPVQFWPWGLPLIRATLRRTRFQETGI